VSGTQPLLPGLHTLILHLTTTGALPDCASGTVALRADTHGKAIVVETFAVGYVR